MISSITAHQNIRNTVMVNQFYQFNEFKSVKINTSDSEDTLLHRLGSLNIVKYFQFMQYMQ